MFNKLNKRTKHLMNNFTLEALNLEVKLIYINTLKFNDFFQNLLKIQLENKKFLSITYSQDEISIIIDKNVYERIFSEEKNENYNVDPKTYNVIQIYEDCSGINHIGIVQKISSIFSENEIPILYINTFNNNFIIIDTESVIKIKNLL